jgi:L-ascorbate metabolism protein UlaG (beta-lactamase superfamily)
VSAAVSITWWGHATTTIAIGGRRVLTDPVVGRHLAHLSRVGGPAPSPAALQADVVVVSHLHYDHLNLPSLRRLGPGVRIVGPKGMARVLRRSETRLSRRVEEVRPGDAFNVDGLHIHAVTAEHDGRRSPLSRHGGPALGFIIGEDGAGDTDRVWFAGDTGLFAAMVDLAPIGVAVVPVGGWGPKLGPTHLDPVEATEAVRRVGAAHAIPIHYGTFWPIGLRHMHPASFRSAFTDPGTRFAAELAKVCPRTTAHVIRPGETAVIPATPR